MQNPDLDLTEQQQRAHAEFRAFVDEEIVPHADRFCQEESIPRALIARLAEKGYWNATLPQEYGGAGMDMLTYGLLTEEIGRGSADVRNLVGVQGMVSAAVAKWGSKEQKAQWLPRMASGEIVAAFALTEPDVGSDAKSIETVATPLGETTVLSGKKKWISFGQNADLFLVFAQCEGKVTAYLVERGTPGFSTKPITGLLGLQASMLAELYFDECRIPSTNLVGRIGFGLSHVASYGLSHGRYSTAWGCVGLAQACLEASLSYTSKRRQFGALLKEHQLIQQMIADMVANLAAARLLCYRAGRLMDRGDLAAVMGISIAKYFASTTAYKAASDAVQVHGANGCGPDYPVQRYLRDAKVLEIVEGSTQVQQLIIARHAYDGPIG
jgi:glutaryl-CoA dehydrogenase (non-decarboxylating)